MTQVLHLAYHDIRQPDDPELPGLWCGYDRFCGQVKWLAENGWTVMTCRNFAGALRHQDMLPDKVATLSFDDGLRAGLQYAVPVLEQYGFRGTFFVISCTLQKHIPALIKFQMVIRESGAYMVEKELLPKVLEGTLYPLLLDPDRFDIAELYGNEPLEVRRIKVVFNRFVPQALREEGSSRMFAEVFGSGAESEWCERLFFSYDEVRELSRRGHEVGSHSMTHPFLPQLSSGEVVQEVEGSYLQLVTALGYGPSTFGWPFGRSFPDRVVSEVAKRYTSAWNYSGQPVMPQLPYPDFYNIPRVDQQYFEKVSYTLALL